MGIVKIVKISLSILFFICLFDMPYGFYQFVRFLALISFVFLAIQSYKEENKTETFIYIALAILFQPLIKISLGRTIWNIVDVIVGAGLIISIFINRQEGKNNH